jgi:hypothetical protein
MFATACLHLIRPQYIKKTGHAKDLVFDSPAFQIDQSLHTPRPSLHGSLVHSR